MKTRRALFSTIPTLFEWNKYSGYDRSEGGVRLNAGAQYTMTFKNGGFANAMIGESFQLAGQNSYATYDVANTGANSGLDTKSSDYVSRVSFSPTKDVSFIAKGRWDQQTWATKRLDLIANFTTGPVTSTVSYGRYAPQPLIGFINWREGLSLSSKYKVTDNWWVSGSVLFDLARWKVEPTAPRFSVAATGLGVGYTDDCTTFSLNYTSILQDTSSGTKTRNQTILLQLNLRTLGRCDGQIRRGQHHRHPVLIGASSPVPHAIDTTNPDQLPPLREVVANFDLQAKRALGQNFLFDLNLTRRIARAAGPLEGATVVEIGPGPGGLTRALLMEGASHVIAIERDPRCVPVLEQIAGAYPGRLTFVEGDASGDRSGQAYCRHFRPEADLRQPALQYRHGIAGLLAGERGLAAMV